jgi:hypothetical protein
VGDGSSHVALMHATDAQQADLCMLHVHSFADASLLLLLVLLVLLLLMQG